MTLLRVYKKNGKPVNGDERDYRFSDMLNDFFGEDHYRPVNSQPRVNILEDKEYYELEMALPGLSKKDIKIGIDKDVLSISHVEQDNSEDTDFTRKEFDFTHFERSFNIPDTINTEDITAKMENGVLRLRLPKRDEAIDRGPREIKIS
jgi:HSP20 family protein